MRGISTAKNHLGSLSSPAKAVDKLVEEIAKHLISSTSYKNDDYEMRNGGKPDETETGCEPLPVVEQ